MTKIVCLENPYWEPWQQQAALEGRDTEPMQGARFVAPETQPPEPSERPKEDDPQEAGKRINNAQKRR